MKDVKMDDVRFVLERFFYGWKMNAIVFDADGKLVDFVMGTREKVDFSKKEELEGSSLVFIVSIVKLFLCNVNAGIRGSLHAHCMQQTDSYIQFPQKTL